MCEEDGSKNVSLPLTADQSGLQTGNRDLKVDELVLVIRSDSPRGRWPLGRVFEVYPGRDGHTRVAKVVCGAKTVLRLITKQ